MKLRTRDTRYEIRTADGAVVTCIPASVPAANRRLAEYTKTKSRRGQVREVVDRAGLAKRLWLDQVKDWDGVTDEDGRPLPCDDSTKAIAWDYNPEWCADVLGQLEDMRAQHLEGEEKN